MEEHSTPKAGLPFVKGSPASPDSGLLGKDCCLIRKMKLSFGPSVHCSSTEKPLPSLLRRPRQNSSKARAVRLTFPDSATSAFSSFLSEILSVAAHASDMLEDSESLCTAENT